MKQNEAKKTKRRTSQNVIRHFGATSIGNLLLGEGKIRASKGNVRAGMDFLF